ncbi:MAG: response regulator [Gammaproteobacteria bacterium]
MSGRRIFIVEPFLLVRSALREMLAAEHDYEVVGEAADCTDLPHQLRASACDIVLLDLNAPGAGGLEMLRHLSRAPSAPRIVALSAFAAPPLPLQALAHGASAFLTKQCKSSELKRALSRVAGGQRYISVAAAQELALAEAQEEGGPLSALSSRELTVLMLVSEGCNRAEISHRLGLSPKTVSTYRCRLIKKLGARSDVDLVRMSLRHGLTVA